MGRDECRIYVGNLPSDIRERELDDLFYKYGRIRCIDLKTRRGSSFAFVEFDDPRDAEDAIDYRDGYNYDGYKLRVEFPHGCGGGESSYGSYSYRGSDSGCSGKSRSSRRGASPPKRSGYRVFVKGLPFSGSWQDLKDHLREAGDVCYADVYHDGTGVAEFVYKEDMKWAIKYLDDTKFRSHEGDSSYVRIMEDGGLPAGSSSEYKRRRFRSRSRSHSRSWSRSESRSRSRSRSVTPTTYKRSYSRSRNRDTRSD